MHRPASRSFRASHGLLALWKMAFIARIDLLLFAGSGEWARTLHTHGLHCKRFSDERMKGRQHVTLRLSFPALRDMANAA